MSQTIDNDDELRRMFPNMFGSRFVPHRPPPEPIDSPSPSEPFPGGWKRFRIRPTEGKPYPYRVEASGGWLGGGWSRYANASSFDAAFYMIPTKFWHRTKVLAK